MNGNLHPEAAEVQKTLDAEEMTNDESNEKQGSKVENCG